MVAPARPIAPREWVGGAAFPWPPAGSLPAGQSVVACYSIVQVQPARTRQDRLYLKLVVADAHGTVPARVWEHAEDLIAWLRPGIFIGVRGRIEDFNGERQISVEEIAPLEVDGDDLDLFLPRSMRDPEEMERELAAFVQSIGDKALRTLLRRMLLTRGSLAREFRRAPAASRHHHAWLGGLLEHTLSVTAVCDALARHYGDALDRDLLIAAALLHDVGKTREILPEVGFPYSDEGKLLGHIVIGMRLVEDAGREVDGLSSERLMLLQHLIASHQGRFEWQSPREPRILEALILHYADDLDAKFTQAAGLLRDVDAGWSAWDRGLGRDFLRHLHRRVPKAALDRDAPPDPSGRPDLDTLDLFDDSPRRPE